VHSHPQAWVTLHDAWPQANTRGQGGLAEAEYHCCAIELRREALENHACGWVRDIRVPSRVDAAVAVVRRRRIFGAAPNLPFIPSFGSEPRFVPRRRAASARMRPGPTPSRSTFGMVTWRRELARSVTR
jgi:hypothetical protein